MNNERKLYYCWRCEIEMPFLDDNEWRQISPLLGNAIAAIKDYRIENKCDLATARENVKPEAMKLFEELTGMPGIHFEVIQHHRRSEWGPECKNCGNLFRTPKASACVNCGQTAEGNT